MTTVPPYLQTASHDFSYPHRQPKSGYYAAGHLGTARLWVPLLPLCIISSRSDLSHPSWKTPTSQCTILWLSWDHMPLPLQGIRAGAICLPFSWWSWAPTSFWSLSPKIKRIRCWGGQTWHAMSCHLNEETSILLEVILFFFFNFPTK